MRELKRDNFGLLIAYLLPGSIALWGVSYRVEVVRSWLLVAPGGAPSIGGFLHATLAATALGLVVSAGRWATIDRLLAWTGVRAPGWNFELLAGRLAAYEWLVANHYRYYQFYANMLVALAFSYASRPPSARGPAAAEWALFATFLAAESLLLAGARDALAKYYARTDALLQHPARRGQRRRSVAKGRGRSFARRAPHAHRPAGKRRVRSIVPPSDPPVRATRTSSAPPDEPPPGSASPSSARSRSVGRRPGKASPRPRTRRRGD